MKSLLAAAAVMLAPCAAWAQAQADGTPYGPQLFRTPLETPTMRRLKYKRALALRAEAMSLLAADGGTLTKEHQAYIDRQAERIRTN